MKILFDQGTPAPLRHALLGHEVSTAHELRWSNLQNGDLLRAAEARFECLITTDKNIKHQQNWSGHRLAVLVLPTTSWPKIRVHQELVSKTVDAMKPGDFQELEFPDTQ